MLAKIEKSLRWVYEWITVLAGIVVGGLSAALEFIDSLGFDWSSMLPPKRAAYIIFGVALLKGLLAYYNSTRTAQQ